MDFKLTSKYSPTGDQPEAIEQLTEGIKEGVPAQVLLGVTDIYCGQCHCKRQQTNLDFES